DRRDRGRSGDHGDAPRLLRSTLAALRTAESSAHEENRDSDQDAAASGITHHRPLLRCGHTTAQESPPHILKPVLRRYLALFTVLYGIQYSRKWMRRKRARLGGLLQPRAGRQPGGPSRLRRSLARPAGRLVPAAAHCALDTPKALLSSRMCCLKIK